MKNMSPLLLAGFIAGWFATTAAAVPQDASSTASTQQQPAQAVPPAAQDTNAAPAAAQTNAAPAAAVASNPNVELTSGTAYQGLTLKLRGVTVDQALSFLSESAGFTINRQTSTSVAAVPGTVDLVSDSPLNRDEIVDLFNKVLANHGLTALKDNKTLTIMTLEDAANNAGVPVNVITKWDEIPQDSEMVTEIIPVHSLNPTQAVKDLYTLIPQGAKMNSNEAGNAIIMTARRADVRRFAQIIAAIDSTGNGDLQVFLLTYADSKAIASELKDVFTDQSGTQGGGNPFAIFARGGGRGGGGGMGAGGAEGSSARATVHVNAVSDDQNNAVLVSAPSDFMPGISNIIIKLDIPQEDTVQIRLFTLRNADCTDVSTELLALFPDPNLQANQNQNGRRGAAQFGGFGGGFGGGAGGRGGNTGTGMSDRMKKQVTVNAVPDPRTQSVLVTASKDTMAQIEKIIEQMDDMDNGHVSVHVVYPTSGDVMDMLAPLQTLFPSPMGTASTASTQNNPLTMRAQQAAQQNTMNSSSSSSGIGGGSSRMP
jgi:type II secretory pathway component GspD/PulD (secretin)